MNFINWCTFLDKNSYDNTSKWIDEVRAERGNDVIIVLVGNKVDINDEESVNSKQAQDYCNQNNLMFIETSAKSGYNVKQLFKKIALALPGNIQQEQVNNDQNVKIEVNSENDNQGSNNSCLC